MNVEFVPRVTLRIGYELSFDDLHGQNKYPELTPQFFPDVIAFMRLLKSLVGTYVTEDPVSRIAEVHVVTIYWPFENTDPKVTCQ